MRNIQYYPQLSITDGTDWIFITNIPAETLSSDDIREIYRMRWMIDIFFRELDMYLMNQ
jgi:IS4 transposase